MSTMYSVEDKGVVVNAAFGQLRHKENKWMLGRGSDSFRKDIGDDVIVVWLGVVYDR